MDEEILTETPNTDFPIETIPAPDVQENSGIDAGVGVPGTVETGDTPEKLLYEKFKDIIETMPKGEEGSIYDGPSLEELYSQKDREKYIAEHGNDEGWVDPFGPVFKVETNEDNSETETVTNSDKENISYEVVDGEVEEQAGIEEVVAEEPIEEIVEPSQPIEVYNDDGERIS